MTNLIYNNTISKKTSIIFNMYNGYNFYNISPNEWHNLKVKIHLTYNINIKL